MLGLLLALSSQFAAAEPLTLADKQGRSITAEIISIEGDTIKIRRSDGIVFELSLATLDAESQGKLKKWADEEASRPLPPDALRVELSRGVFKSRKENVDVTLTTGRVVKNGATITEEQWGYGVTLTNTTPRPIDNLRAEYRLFATIENVHVKGRQGLRKKAYKSTIETIPKHDRIVFRTETVAAIKTRYNGNIVSARTGESSSRETLYGIWMRIYRGDVLVHEVSMPESLSLNEKW